MKVLDFRHFAKHCAFDGEGEKFRNKQVKDYIAVKVIIDVGYWNTRN